MPTPNNGLFCEVFIPVRKNSPLDLTEYLYKYDDSGPKFSMPKRAIIIETKERSAVILNRFLFLYQKYISKEGIEVRIASI
jgi:hypothetical protein